jgi:two-component system, NarL family, response regulator DesR
MFRVVIAEDHELVRLGVRLLLARSHRYCVVAETASASEVEALARAGHAELILFDLELADGSGATTIAALKAALPDLKVLVVTGDASASAARCARDAGADGFVLKDGCGDHLLHAADMLMAGERPLGTGHVTAVPRFRSPAMPYHA